MAKAKQGLIRGMGTHRRTEGDYMAALLDTVTLEDWRDVVAGALQLPKGGRRPGAGMAGAVLGGQGIVQRAHGADGAGQPVERQRPLD